jgi:hypothetical protein
MMGLRIDVGNRHEGEMRINEGNRNEREEYRCIKGVGINEG